MHSKTRNGHHLESATAAAAATATTLLQILRAFSKGLGASNFSQTLQADASMLIELGLLRHYPSTSEWGFEPLSISTRG